MSNNYLLKGTFLVSLLFSSPVAIAQESGGFFPNDFVNAPQAGQEAEDADEAQEEVGNIEQEIERNNEPSQDQDMLDMAKEPVIESDSSAPKVISVSAVVDGFSAQQLQEVYEDLLSLYNKRGVSPARVHVVGNSVGAGPELASLVSRLVALGVEFKLDKTPPANIKVKSSPTWIITTDAGDIVLEGLKSPHRFISSDKRFIAEPTMLERPEPEGVEGF